MLGPVYIYWGRLSVLAGISLLDCVRVCAWFCSCCCCSCAVVDVVVAILCVFTTSFFPISQLPFIIIPENSFLVYGRMLTAFSTVFDVVRINTNRRGSSCVDSLNSIHRLDAFFCWAINILLKMDFQMEEKWRRRMNSMRSKKSVKWLQLLSNFKPIKRRILAMNGNRLLMKTPQQISGCSNHGASAEKSNESIWKLFSVDIWQKQLKLVILSSILRSACSPNSQNPFWLHPLRMGFYSMHTFLCCVFDFQVYLNSSSSLLRCFCFVACLGCLTPISTRPQQAAAADRNKSKNEMMHKCTRTDEMWKEKPPKWNWNLMFLRSFISFFFLGKFELFFRRISAFELRSILSCSFSHDSSQ